MPNSKWRDREETPTDLPSLLDRLQSLQVAEGVPWPSKNERITYAFRGVPCHDWDLEPTLLHRIKSKGKVTELQRAERYLVCEFRRRAWRFLRPDERNWLGITQADLVRPDPVGRPLEWEDPKIWNVLAVARHYGVPSRLLDWSYNIHVAAYFAACGEFSCNGAIWWFNQNELENSLTWDDWKVPKRTDGSEERALEKKAFGADATPWITKIHSGPPFRRMEVQKGFFTACGAIDWQHQFAVDELDKDVRRGRLIMRTELKNQLLDVLERMNVHASTLDYQGADAVGSGICSECAKGITW